MRFLHCMCNLVQVFLLCFTCVIFGIFSLNSPVEKLLLQVGEIKLVLEMGRAALQRPDAKPYIHDLLLSMALAEVLCEI